MKSYTDLEQSKKLAEMLPKESADMVYLNGKVSPNPIIDILQDFTIREDIDIPCWSLAALLSVLPFIDFTAPQLIGTPKTLYICKYNDDLRSHAYGNPIDACYDMILKLHELKML